MIDSRTSPFFFLDSKEVREFIARALDIPAGKNYPSHNYFAFNFRDDELVNAKIYFSFFRRLNDQEVSTVLPVMSDFKKYYPLWQHEPARHINHTGCAFAIKVGADFIPTYQFHFRFPWNQKLVLPKLVTLGAEDMSSYHGISFEYKKQEQTEKRYYYLRNSPACLQVLKRFEEPFRDQLIEYTETDKISKIIHWFETVSQSRQYFRDYAGPRMNQLIDDMKEKYGCVALYPGVYQDKRTRSVYFFRPNNQTDRLFYDPINNCIKTVENVLAPYLTARA
jgi:hypothetical protein